MFLDKSVLFALLEVGVATYHCLEWCLGVLVAGEFVVHLLEVAVGESLDVFLPFATEDGDDWVYRRAHHIVEEVMALDVEVGVVRTESEGGELCLEGGEFAFRLGIVLLEICHFAVGIVAHSFDGIRIVHHVESFHIDDVVERGERKLREAVGTVYPDGPYEEFVDGFAVGLEIAFKVEYGAVVEGSHHADLMQTRSVALEVLYSVCIGVDHIGVVEHEGRIACVSHEEVVEICIDTGYHVSSESFAQTVHHGDLLASIEVGLGWEHDFEVAFVVLKIGQYAPPEEHVVIRFDVCYDFLPFCLLELVGCIEIARIEV